MAIKINIELEVSNLSELGKEELMVLRALSGEAGDTKPKRTGIQTKTPAAKKSQPVKEEPAKEEPAKGEPAKEEPVKEETEDVVPSGGSVEAAVQAATQLVADGKSSTVKKALAAVGAKRVSELTAEQVDEFMSNLA